MRFQRFQLTVHRDTHRTGSPLNDRFRRVAICPMQTRNFLESAVENLLRARQIITTPLAFLVQARQFNAGPNLSSNASASREAALESGRLMMAQDAIEKPIKINMISLTRRLAFRNESRIFMSVTA